jgi:hypothetical protein
LAVAVVVVSLIAGLEIYARITGSADPPTHQSSVVSGGTAPALAGSRWAVVEVHLTSQSVCAANCYTDQAVSAVFTPPAGSSVAPVTAQGFLAGTGWAAGQPWTVRFTPTVAGTWTYRTTPRSSDNGLTQSGSIAVGAAQPGSHGFLRTVGQGFQFDDGTPFFLLGDTDYSLISEQRFDPASAHATIVNAKASGITKLRVLAYPWPTTPPSAPFTDSNKTHSALDQTHFAALDAVISDAAAQGMEIELELFADNSNDFYCARSCPPPTSSPTCSRSCPGWPGPNAVDDNYVKYVVSRYAAYTNVEWTLTNEFQYTPYPDTTPGVVGAQRPGYWDHIGSLVAASDPYMTSSTLGGAKRPTAIHSTTNWPNRGSGGTVIFAPAAAYPWQSSTSMQYHRAQCVTYPGSAGFVVQSDALTAGPVLDATNRSADLPLVVDEWSYLTNDRDGCATAPNPTNDVSIRWGAWAAAAAGGYSSIGNGAPSTGSWDKIPDPPLITGKWQDGAIQGTMYGDTSRLTSFFVAHGPALAGRTADLADSSTDGRVYVSSVRGRAFVGYAAAAGPIGLSLTAGVQFDVSAYNVTTGAVVPIPGVTNPVTGNGTKVMFNEPANMGQAGDWAIYAAAVGSAN